MLERLNSRIFELILSSIMKKPHTGLDDCLNMLLSCFRKKMSGFDDPQVTFEKLIPEARLEPGFLRAVRNIDYTSPVTKINVAVNKLPNFTADPNTRGEEPMPHHRSVTCIIPWEIRFYYKK